MDKLGGQLGFNKTVSSSSLHRLVSIPLLRTGEDQHGWLQLPRDRSEVTGCPMPQQWTVAHVHYPNGSACHSSTLGAHWITTQWGQAVLACVFELDPHWAAIQCGVEHHCGTRSSQLLSARCCPIDFYQSQLSTLNFVEKMFIKDLVDD